MPMRAMGAWGHNHMTIYGTQSQAQSRPHTHTRRPPARRCPMTACFDVSLDVCRRHRRRLRLQQNPRAILFGAMLGGAEHRLHLFVVDLVVDDEVDLLALAVDRLREAVR